MNTNTNRIVFNTGRLYSDRGQRIAAERLPCGRVCFVDVDRHLDYVTAAPCNLTQHAVMRAYDHNDTISIYEAVPDFDARRTLIAELETLARSI